MMLTKPSIHGAKPTATRKHRGIDPRGSHQMNMLACPLGSLPAGIKISFDCSEIFYCTKQLTFYFIELFIISIYIQWHIRNHIRIHAVL